MHSSFTAIASVNKDLKEVDIETTMYPPYFNIDKSGKLSGISYQIANEVFKKAGYKANFNVLPYKRAVLNLFDKKDGIMMGIFAGIPGYEKMTITEVSYLLFPTTYFYNSKLRPEYSSITKIDQTKGKKVLVLAGTSLYEDIITNSGGQAIKLTNESQVLAMLEAGRADFAHTSLLSGLHSIQMNPSYSILRALPFYTSAFASGVVFREDSFEVRDAYLKAIKKMHKSGELIEIAKKAFKAYPSLDYSHMFLKNIGEKTNIPVSTQ